MNDLNSSQQSFVNKRRRGLSLSLQKKKPSKDQNQQHSSAFKNTANKQTIQALNQSVRKNKIKFVQSYHKNQSGSKFKKQNWLKNTSQDIKLGGNKKPLGHQRKLIVFPNTAYFSQYNSNLESFPQQTVVPYLSQRKALRESKTVNLTSNINYFQNMNLQKQNLYSTCQVQKQIQNYQLKRSSDQQHINEALPIQSVNNFKEHTQDKINEQIESIKKESFSDQKQRKIKQSMDKVTIQKLKKVQMDIDQLLAKASQTKSLIFK